MIVGWWSLSLHHSYSWHSFFLTPYSSLGRDSTSRGRASLKRGLFGDCCALLGLPMALSQHHMGWVCPLLRQEFLQPRHPGAESDSAS